MDFNIFGAETYQVDKPLFDILGFKKFSINNRDKTFVGTYNSEDFVVHVFVTCLPAQFWSFEINNKKNDKRLKIDTGSGSLSEYWKTVEMITQGMLDIKLK